MTTQSHKQAAIEFLTMAASGKICEAYERHIAPGFRHHNPCFHGDAASLKEAMQTNAQKNPGKVLDVQRALQDGDLVAIHSRVRLRPEELGIAVVHLFRFEGKQIIELWDVGQPVLGESVNENGMF